MKRIILLLEFYFLLLAASGAFAASDQVVFASYNVENYLPSDRPVDGKYEKGAMKPESEINALIRVIKEINPDILGVCEMGSQEHFDDFKERLKTAGLGYTDFELVNGADPDRHLALVSRFPISSRQSLPDVSYELNGKAEKVRRGFLDVTVKVAKNFDLRLVGSHLKSKRDISEGEALIRRNEAHLLRQHFDKIMAEKPNVKLLAYGDFNDTKNEPPIQEIMGPRNSPTHMTDLWLKDSIGDRWTHYWKTADIYSRIDFIFVNDALRKDVVQAKCGIYRSEIWNDASDHRAIFASFRVGASGSSGTKDSY